MPLRIELCSLLRRYVADYDPANGISLDVETGSTVEQAIRQLGLPIDEVQLIIVNRMAVKLSHQVKEGDRVGLFSVVTGG